LSPAVLRLLLRLFLAEGCSSAPLPNSGADGVQPLALGSRLTRDPAGSLLSNPLGAAWAGSLLSNPLGAAWAGLFLYIVYIVEAVQLHLRLRLQPLVVEV
jgi:hypothetical protein